MANLPVLPEEEEEPNQDRETLRQLLAALGIELPVNLSDLTNTSKEIVRLKEQIDQAVEALGPGFGTTQEGPSADPERQAQIAALSDLQNQLHDVAGMFENYAQEYFGPKDETKSIGLSAHVEAYQKGLQTREQVMSKAAELGYTPDETGLLLDMADVDKQKGRPTLGQSALSDAFQMGKLDNLTYRKRLTELGYSDDDVNIIMSMEMKAKQDALDKKQQPTPESRHPGRFAAGNVGERTQPQQPRQFDRISAKDHVASFEERFNSALTNAMKGGGLGPNEEEFARNYIQPMLFTRYNNAILEEQRRSARGSSSAGTSTTGIARSSDPSDPYYQPRVGQSGGSYRASADALLAGELTPARIKLLYEGSRKGAGQFQSSTTGDTVARRI